MGDWHRANHVEPSTWGSLWDVVRGEAMAGGLGESQVAAILDGLAARLSSTVAIGPFAEEIGVHRGVLEARLQALTGAFLLWPCPAADAAGRPAPRRLAKQYFLDPLVARIPELSHGRRALETSVVSEQQLGVELLRWNERARPGSARAGGWVTHHRSGATEVDFAGRCADTHSRATPLESKLGSGAWRRDALTIRNGQLREGVLATRDVLEVDPGEPVWAVPAAFVAYTLSAP